MFNNKLKIGMVDVDLLNNGTRHPNLAQMKMSAFCKGRGHDVRLVYKEKELRSLEEFDVLLVSKVFISTKNPESISAMWESCINGPKDLNLCVFKSILQFEKKKPVQTEALIGGSGFFEDGGINLDDEIEHHMPDYTLYEEYVNYKISNGRTASYFKDYMHYSIGFTSRGCFRKCEFCINKKYDRSEKWSPISEFIDESRKGIYLWDDNILACKDWEMILDELDATGKQFQFRQGLDIRLLNEKKAQRLSNSRYYGDFIFAFDNVDDRKIIENKLRLWRKYSKRETKLYLLCAYDSWNYTDPSKLKDDAGPHQVRMANLKTQKERDLLDIEFLFERIKVMIEHRCLPYVMRYEKYQESEYRGLYIQIARWCNQPRIFKKMSFREFCFANQRHAKTERICSSMSAYYKIEEDCPELVEKYFNMTFRTPESDINMGKAE